MEATTKAVLHDIRIAPRKVRVVVDLIRGMGAAQALTVLQFAEKRAAEPVRKLLDSAIHNAVNSHSMDADALYVAQVYVDQARTLKRWQPRAFGRATRILKKSSHVTLILSVR